MVNILIVDGHPIVRKGLESYLSAYDDYKIVGSIGSGIEIFDFVRHHSVDLIISEIDLPELNGITALRAIKKEYKQINILIFSHQPEEIYAISTLKAGASGYLSKSAAIEKIADAINTISNGNAYLSEKMDKHYKYNDTSKSW